ncbi:MAG TPA: phospholipase D-like domain-containing protein [Nitrosospira sp.]|nr:phospholipase D-like domain-containing protein [Nitrosospira sp.]
MSKPLAHSPRLPSSGVLIEVETVPFEIYFGGPDRPPGYLRDVLAAHIAAVPSGGTIDWVTYYFRDMRLAEALVQAHRRGVKVTVTLEGKPRVPYANDEVITLLSQPDGLGKALRIIRIPGIPALMGKSWKPQLHEKLYCFSHPAPIAFVGSFNPSGNMPDENPEIIRELGDQDRGHNVLVGLVDPVLVAQLAAHARCLHRVPPGLLYRFSAHANETICGKDATIYFWPRIHPHPVLQFLAGVRDGARVRVVASHIRTERAVEVMTALARRGITVQILAESTQRRVTAKVERRFSAANMQFSRFQASEDLPMHLKFILVEDGDYVFTIFGSFNWTKPSFWLNHEIAVISSNPGLFRAFATRWEVLKNETNPKAVDSLKCPD